MPEAYSCNYLENVIWRVDYPLNFGLRDEGPARFQSQVQGRFPKSQETMEVTARTKDDERDPIQVQQATRQWMFWSLDQKRRITLTASYLGLDDYAYVDYRAFRDQAEAALNPLVSLYAPPVVTRCGLRYVNVIKLRGDPLDWNGFLNPALVAHLAFKRDRDLIYSTHEMRLTVGDHKVTLRFGLHNPDAPEPAAKRWFRLDIDCYSQDDVEPDRILRETDRLHECAKGLFEESIEPRLRERMVRGDCHEE